ncbi:TetR/AcrR family transcriptional regulator [Rhizobium tropici]|uniref:AcrR family transcriptional regulator n=1 Tax=Rhizobium tropici TaxID=398 RepID=A0ABR6QX99_RHITR|nr:transcriptional regulator, TetR family [Rhizobium tropici CIAT 899]MBB4241193.1 AcrR family transcriptional regulator [Rhizobium tropici]MBB5592261.1 AcrR family transcriptional regulator [Rhizobium tropici]MBB6491518.1 AcrR family transcriptional regulator [Rhizobium tropici]
MAIRKEQTLARKPLPEPKNIAPSESRRLRADARRNHDKLIEVAAQAFASHGTVASLEDIARRADVGIGTLYRHFPSREHLVEAVYRHEVEALCDAAEELSRERAPDEALEEWMNRFVGYIATKRGMADSLRILLNSNSKLFADSYGQVPVVLSGLIDRAVAAGTIRTDVDSTDVLQALSGTYSMPNSPEWYDRSRRLVRLLMDGLRWGAPKMRMSQKI